MSDDESRSPSKPSPEREPRSWLERGADPVHYKLAQGEVPKWKADLIARQKAKAESQPKAESYACWSPPGCQLEGCSLNDADVIEADQEDRGADCYPEEIVQQSEIEAAEAPPGGAVCQQQKLITFPDVPRNGSSNSRAQWEYNPKDKYWKRPSDDRDEVFREEKASSKGTSTCWRENICEMPKFDCMDPPVKEHKENPRR